MAAKKAEEAVDAPPVASPSSGGEMPAGASSLASSFAGVTSGFNKENPEESERDPRNKPPYANLNNDPASGSEMPAGSSSFVGKDLNSLTFEQIEAIDKQAEGKLGSENSSLLAMNYLTPAETSGAAAGTIAGGAVSVVASGGCDVATEGACAPANPIIVGEAAAGGAYIGKQIGTGVDKIANIATNAWNGIFNKTKDESSPPTLPTTAPVATPPPPHQDDDDKDQGVKLTNKAKEKMRNIMDTKDKTARQAILDRGGNGSNVNRIGHLADHKVGDIANNAAQGDKDAEAALKIIKQAKDKGEKY